MNGFGQLVTPQQYAAQNLQLAQQTDQVNRQNALQGLIQSQGPAAAQGDRNALSQIAQMDPKLSQELQEGALSNEQGMRAKQLQSAGIMAGLMNSVRGDPQRLEFVKRFAVEKMGLPQEMVQGVTMEQLPTIIQGVIPITEQINSKWDQEQFMLTAKDTETAFEQELATYRKFGREDLIPAALESKAKGRGGTSINVNTGDQYGKIPQGFMITEDPNTGERTMQPVPGSEFAGDRSAGAFAARQKYEAALEDASIINNTIADALALTEGDEGFWGVFDGRNYSTGLMGDILKEIGGTTAKNLSKKLETLEGHIGLDRLGELKAQSATGASGMGALSEKELRLLTNVKGSLDQAQSREQLQQVLLDIQTMMADRPRRFLEAYVADIDKFGPEFREQADRQMRAWGMKPPGSLQEARQALQSLGGAPREANPVASGRAPAPVTPPPDPNMGPQAQEDWLQNRVRQLMDSGLASDPGAALDIIIENGEM